MYDTILFLHIAAGVVALATAGMALVAHKGARVHRLSGRTYAAAMLGVGLTTFVLVALKPNAFLFAIGIFSLYLVFTGWRAARLRDGRPRGADHAAGGLMALTGGVMMAAGLGELLSGGSQPVILLVFGSIGLTLALTDWRDWRRGPVRGGERIGRHLTRMMAGTIATLTAAAVVNLDFLPPLVTWLGPTVLITPAIFWWNRRVRRVPAAA